MAIRNGQPGRFTPKGICDAFDATDAFPGACQLLSNLIFDQGNPEVTISRPGVGTALTTFGSFTSPTFVTVHIALGTVIYGMVATARNAGHDEPFAYDTATNTFITISGVTAGNTPTTPSTSGPWNPPTMAVVSTKILVTHPGFNGAGSNFFGVIDITTPATPSWTATNTATNALPGVPTTVANFNNRAFFSVGNVNYFSDVLVPTTRTNATQSVTVGDTTPITAQAGLPLQTTSSGVLGALSVFKGTQIWQITGDSATNNLALNYISLTTGTVSPRSVVQWPLGIAFAGVDGPYNLSYYGTLGPLARPNAEVADIQRPFQNATTPSRIAANYSGNTYRTCFDTIIQGIAQTNDYWFDIRRMRWTGPHTFTYDCASQISDFFILSGSAHGAALFKSQTIPDTSSVYNDAGTNLFSHLRSSSFPKTGHMAEVQVVESTIELSSSGASVNYNITALDTSYNTINSTFVVTNPTGVTWGGGAIWGGGGLWTSSSQIPKVYTIPWTKPLVFQKMSIDVTATSSNSVTIGTFFARYQDTGYINM
jgi:hypothetical protein